MRRLIILATLIALISTVYTVVSIARHAFTYPVRVSFHFNYGGKPVEASYLTVVRKGLGNFLEISLVRYTHGRGRFSLKLPDGSKILLSPGWPFEWQGFDAGKSYRSAADWFWQDRARQPTEVVHGGGFTAHEASRTTAAPFPWLDVTATIERVDDASLPEAVRADAVFDNDDKFQNPNSLGFDFRGTLFTSTVILPIDTIDQARREQIEGSSGWAATSENCRFKPISDEDESLLSGLTRYKDRVGLLRAGTSWTGDGGPRPGEPIVLYSTGKRVQRRKDNFSVAPFQSVAIGMVHAVKLDGATCSGITAPVDSRELLIRFSNGKLALIEPSGFIAILSN